MYVLTVKMPNSSEFERVFKSVDQIRDYLDSHIELDEVTLARLLRSVKRVMKNNCPSTFCTSGGSIFTLTKK